MVIEDIVAQSHLVVDSLSFETGTIALSALRTLGDGQKHGGAFTRLIGVEFQQMESGKCRAALKVRHHHMNPFGIAHGGVVFSLADSVCGGAAVSVLDLPRVVTQDMQIRYHGPVAPGEIVAAAEVIHHGQRTITTQCRVTQGEVLVASITATFAILSDTEVRAISGVSDNKPS